MIRVDQFKRRSGQTTVGPSPRLVSLPAATTQAPRPTSDEPTQALTLRFSELALIYKSLQAAKTLGALPPQDELLNDTIQIVDQALNRAAYEPRRPFRPVA
jgi:hypothetical protein